MSVPFYRGSEAQIYEGTLVFSTRISATPTAYGLTAAQATAYATVSSAFRTAYDVAKNPATRTKSNVQAKNDAKKTLQLNAAQLAKIIEAAPGVTNQQKLDLGLNVRKTPAPLPPPGTPYEFKVSLNGNGDVELKWKCDNPRSATGTIYQIFRQINGVGEYEYVGGAGQRSFTDTTAPAGSKRLTYQVQAIRSTSAGPWAEFNVNFGKTANGTSVASVTETTPAKLAA